MSADWLAHPFKLIDSTGINSRGEIPRGHGCIRNAQLMALTHNTIFRGLNAVYHYAAQVERGSQEAADLLLHCYMVYDFIHVHHVSEEEVYFPRLEAAAGVPDLMKENIEQHKAFENTLEALKVYATQTSKEEYDAATLRGLIEAMVGPLGSHLHEEIPTILDLWDKIDSKTMNKIYGQMHDYATKSSDSFKAGPFVVLAQDRSFLIDGQSIWFPEVPSIAMFIVDNFISRKYSRAWKFSPSNAYGVPHNGKMLETLSSTNEKQVGEMRSLKTKLSPERSNWSRAGLLTVVLVVLVWIWLYKPVVENFALWPSAVKTRS